MQQPITLMGMLMGSKVSRIVTYCGGTGTEITLPTNTVQVPITTGTVTDSGSECTGFIG